MENTMTQRLKFASFILLAAAAAGMMPTAKADEWDKTTVLTFNAPVEIPGHVLAAGTYVFKLFDSDSERNVVQVFTQDEKQLVATIIAIRDYRQEPTGDTVVRFEERSSGSPEALHSWFYPGDNYGVQFVYPKAEQQYAERSAPPAPEVQPVAEAPAPEPEPAPALDPLPAFDTAAVVSENVIIEEEAPAAPVESVPATPDPLPQTAGNFAAIPLLGVLLLSGGLTAVRFAARQN